MKKTGLITSILLSICISSMAQDKSYLAKVEYEMAEETLAAKKYTEVREHLNKAEELLGAGLTVNDIITRIGYRKIYSFSDLRTAVFLYSPGEIVELEYYRNEVPYTTKVVIDKSEN